MTKCEWAVRLAREGFFIFPIVQGEKAPPALNGWQDLATRDEEKINWWWMVDDYNIGISTSRYGAGGALIVVDIDTKGVSNGYDSLLRLELEKGWTLPETRCHTTPSGGRHLFYHHHTPVRQGAHVLGRGVDVRSKGGYVVAPGSETGAGSYTLDSGDAPIAPAPEWLWKLLALPRSSAGTVQRKREPSVSINAEQAEARVIRYLLSDAPAAVEGEGGDSTTYKVIQRCKDLGIAQEAAARVLQEYYNPRCVPPWDPGDLATKVANAYRYGINEPGSSAPEIEFPPVATDAETLHPYHKLNQEYALVLAGGGAHILWETEDHRHKDTVEHLDVAAFKLKFAPNKMMVGKKETSIANQWLEWKGRRSYDGIIFSPGEAKEVNGNGSGKKFFNLWRGFAVTPAPVGARHPAVDMFLEHTRFNVCGDNEPLYAWLLGYFAHLVQRPWDKPLVSLVFRGAKGVGKNACIERIGALLGRHFILTSNRRYLVGNFNGHLENCLLFALDEAFWSGDKQAEGTLKDIITGREHVIEHKGKEPYTVANKTRVVILGNEEWLIPASHDERRFAVFDVGDGRKQDRAFFTAMREGMEAGGYAVLLRTLLDYDITGLELNAAPSTQGLVDQKIHSLNAVYHWWHQCLEQERIIGAEFEGWPATIEQERFRLAFQRHTKERRVTLWHHEDTRILKILKKCAPSLTVKRLRGEGGYQTTLELPPLSVCRQEWDTFIQHPSAWEAL